MNNRNFQGVWIPKHLWLDRDLSATEKFLILEIDSLDNEDENPGKGCFASNEYLAKFLGVKEKTVANLISSLKERGVIKRLWFDGKNRGLRVPMLFELRGASRKSEPDEDASRKNDSLLPEIGNERTASRNREHSNTELEVNKSVSNTEDEIIENSSLEDNSCVKAHTRDFSESGNAQGTDFRPAQIFQSAFTINLDAPTICYIAEQVGSEENFDVWREICGDHWVGMTAQQKASETYCTNALKFCLQDFRRRLEKRGSQNSPPRPKPNYPQKPKDGDLLNPDYKGSRARTFGELVETNMDDPEFDYEKFKAGWSKAIIKKGKQNRLEEIEQYEGLERTKQLMADRKAKQGIGQARNQ